MVLCIALSLEEHASRGKLSKSTSRYGSTRQHLLLVKKFVSWEHRKDNAPRTAAQEWCEQINLKSTGW